MNVKTSLAIAAVALSLVACETVTSPVPLGEKPATLVAEEWEGRWANDEGFLDLEVIDAANGLVRIAYDEAENGECREMELQLRTAGDSGGEWMFFNVTEEDFERSEGLASSPCTPARPAPGTAAPQAEDGATVSYLWGRVRQSGDAIYAWGPNPKAFVRLVNAGQLPGTVDDGSVVLGPLSAEHYQLIISGDQGVVLEWEDPLVLYRRTKTAD